MKKQNDAAAQHFGPWNIRIYRRTSGVLPGREEKEENGTVKHRYMNCSYVKQTVKIPKYSLQITVGCLSVQP